METASMSKKATNVLINKLYHSWDVMREQLGEIRASISNFLQSSC